MPEAGGQNCWVGKVSSASGTLYRRCAGAGPALEQQSCSEGGEEQDPAPRRISTYSRSPRVTLVRAGRLPTVPLLGTSLATP